MGCNGCGSRGILAGSVTARNRVKVKRVKGYSGSGILKSARRLALEANPEVKSKRVVKKIFPVTE